MKKKSIGVIGAGKHFMEKIFPVMSNSNFYKINGILRKNNKPFKNIPIFLGIYLIFLKSNKND